MIWLLRHLRPDFKTIADFRRENCHAFRQVFRQFVLLCRQLDLFGRELLAVDGTRIKAVNNKNRNFTRATLTEFIKVADAKLDDYLQRLDESDAIETGTGGARVKNLADKIAAISKRRERHKDMLAELDRTGESQMGLKKINYVNKLVCRDCPIRSQCTGNRFRFVSRLENEAVLDRMQVRILRHPDILNQRRETVEHPFGSIKQWMNQGAFLMRGLPKVRAEFSLTALAYNLRRALNIVGISRLMEAL